MMIPIYLEWAIWRVDLSNLLTVNEVANSLQMMDFRFCENQTYCSTQHDKLVRPRWSP